MTIAVVEITPPSGPVIEVALAAGQILAAAQVALATEQASNAAASAAAAAASVLSLGTAALLASDIDGTLSANSDTRIATQKAVRTYVDTAVIGLLDFKGATDCSANPNYPAASKGDFYIASVAGKIGGASGTVVEAGDAYYATANNAGGTEASVGTSWAHVEHNLVLGTMATQNANGIAVTGGTMSGVAITGDVSGNAGTATKWATARDLSLTGDGTATLSNVDGSAAVSSALTLATVNSNVGTFGSASKTVTATVNAKGLVTAFSEANVVCPSSTFASLPAASTVSGQTWLVTDVGPAPGILLTSNGTIWRPLGGRQVLAMRAANPVTVQDLAGAVAETIGPFPGGLVKAGMRLEMIVDFRHSGIGTGIRTAQALVNGNAIWWYSQVANSGADLAGNRFSAINVVSDTSAAHRRWASTTNSFAAGQLGTTSIYDFSAPWYINLLLTSCSETAVNITAASWAAGVATYTATAHTLAVGDKTTIAGITPSGYNGVLVVTSVPDANTFTAAVVADPGAYTSGGTSSRISNMISQSYVLELIG